jgi:MFS family permease
MMFLELFVNGCTIPILSLYLKDYLHFTGTQIGWILATSAVSSIISPVLNAFIADRLISAERLLAISHFAGAAVMMVFTVQKDFVPVLLLYMVYWSIIGPTFALTAAITFHHSADAAKSFGGIRLWGTLGWFASAWAISFLWVRFGSGDLRIALHVAVISSVILGIYSLFLPVGLARKNEKIVLLPIDSIKVLLQPEVLSISILSLVITFVDRFYIFGAAPFIKSFGFSENSVMPILSIGQIPEILGLAVLGYFLKRFPLKKILLAGVLFEIIRFAIFFSETSGAILFAGIAFHGLTYAYFFIPAMIFLDSRSDKYSRAGAHQLSAMLNGGIGSFAGNLLAGFAADFSRLPGESSIYYPLFWAIPMVLSVSGFIGVMLLIKDHHLRPGEKVLREEPAVESGIV